jgi:ATP-dependent helicase/nuclease subunit A
MSTDEKQRQLALNPRGSFIVQAPAGSGKTELLTQRFLTLLALVQSPEEILAITFTKKAAFEMRQRIIDALTLAKKNIAPDSPHQAQTLKLAQAALTQNQKHEWELLDNPNRLRIQTIDAFCTSITRQLPILSQFGAEPNIADIPDELYLACARDFLSSLEENPAWQNALQTLLIHLDNNDRKIESLLVSMLKKRDHWLPYLITDQSKGKIRQQLEKGLENINLETIEEVNQLLTPKQKEEILELLQYASSYIDPEHPISSFKDEIYFPEVSLSKKTAWMAITELLLTNTLTVRKQINKNLGFPAKSFFTTKEEKQASGIMKEKQKAFSESLATQHELVNLLGLLKSIPPIQYTESQWDILSALLDLLPVTSAYLNLHFKTSNQIDFTEIALAALEALGTEEAPTDLTLYFDYKLQHILIDEFQDTSITQLRLLEKLTMGWENSDGRSLFLVGDPMQSIYRFRNAEVGLFLKAQKTGVGHISLQALRLEANFRSNEKIIDWINQSFLKIFPESEDISSGAVTFSPSIASRKTSNPSVFYHLQLKDKEEEAKEIVRIIKENTLSNVAILVQTRPQLTDIIRDLHENNIEFSAIDIDPLHKLPYIQDLVALTTALLHFEDAIAWCSILRAPWCGLTLKSLSLLENNSKQVVWDSLQDESQIALLDHTEQERLKHLVQCIKKSLSLKGRKPLSAWIEDTWYDLAGIKTLTSKQASKDCEEYFALLDNLDQGSDILSIEVLHQHLEKLFANPAQSKQARVSLMTIHKSKGLEFDIVILPGLEKSMNLQDSQLMLWTERTSKHNESELILAPIHASDSTKDTIYSYLYQLEKQRFEHENRRLFYVAVTRAKNQLHFFSSGTHSKRSFLNYLNEANPDLLATKDNDREKIKSDKHYSQQLIRLPLDELNIANNTAFSGSNNIKDLNLDWQLKNEAKLGTAIHRCLQIIGEHDLASIDPKQILREQGLLDTDNTLLQKINETISLCLNDKRGKWILSKHDQDFFEYPITTSFNNETKRLIIDRLFIEDNTLWIIDYKTSHMKTDNTQSFFNDQFTLHKNQLSSYVHALKPLFPIRTRIALYYPLIQEWFECTELLMHNTSSLKA